ncbi:hypothetical protein CAP35_08425 [Chitinophagaceae bacterium IBVUCB1]|nr:hypothetical protein CAP35_08425 [Chitinophagaceae bacterium IBVUCB1]
MNFRKINNLTGWITGIIATTVYLMTMEPTVSFWDCGEFLSCAYKVEVGHSPGAPLFMLIQRMFGLLAGSNVEKVAMMINAWSAIASGLTILFLFWTITHFAKKLTTGKDEEPNGLQTTLIMGAGLVGALAYTFSDTFWFSAVEAEVYATSSLFTALVFWAILKWEHIADTKYADRWLVFIAYMMGLTVGIHLLNLLAIPAVAMVYYFKRYKHTTSGAISAFLIGCVLLAFVQFGVLQGVPILASKFDLLFVNDLGLPFDSGALVAVVLIVGLLVWLLMFAKKKNWYLVHTGVLCVTFIVIGFSSYLAPIIRSRADVAIDMTNPDNAISLTSYIQREQFGQQPLLFGPDFDIPQENIEYKDKGIQYAQSKKNGKDYYEEVGKKIEPTFDASDKRFFPRIWDYNDPAHKQYYRDYLGLEEGESPTTSDNLSFFFGYHINWMWWRYFMWNYSGRQNDLQGNSNGNARNGNWITGINVIDKNLLGLGDQKKMSDGLVNDAKQGKHSPANNKLYMLPFILGVLGLVYQFNRNKQDGVVTATLFFFTGIAIAIYLNMTPQQPRERDYAFAGSTYAFAIWIGLGVLMVNEWLQRAVKGASGAYAAIALCLLAVPTLMASEEWDDHDRSKKTLARATAYNVLQSCEKDAILFTYGDNDTYPVWYLQEIEGIRRDVRVINLSLLGIDWYIDQLNYRINDAMPVPMLWQKKNYIGDNGNYMQYYANPQIPQDKYLNLTDVCKFMASEDPQNKLKTQSGEMVNYIPTQNFFLPALSKSELVQRGLINAADTNKIVTDVKFKFPKNVAIKDDLATLNIIAAIAGQGWNRPIYFGGFLQGENYQGLDDYLRMEGLVYRLMPYRLTDSLKATQQEMGSIDIAKSLRLFNKEYIWGNADRNDVYFDEKNRLMFAAYRMNGSRLASELAANNRKDEGIAVLDKVQKSITERSYFYDLTAYYIAMSYYHCGEKKKAAALTKKVVKNCEDNINYALSLSDTRASALRNEVQRDATIINILANIAKNSGDMAVANELEAKLTIINQRVTQKIQF